MTGSRPSATATSIRPSRRAVVGSGRPCGSASASRSSAASSFCIRYMPTLRAPVRGSRVITAGSVMNGAGVARPARLDRERSRSTSSPSSTTSWHGAAADGLRQRVGDRLQLAAGRAPSRRGPAAAASRARPRASRATSSSALDAEGQAHPPLGAELVDEKRGLRALRRARRAAPARRALTTRSTISVTSRCGSTSAVDADELALALEERDPVAQVGGERQRAASASGGASAPARARRWLSAACELAERDHARGR